MTKTRLCRNLITSIIWNHATVALASWSPGALLEAVYAPHGGEAQTTSVFVLWSAAVHLKSMASPQKTLNVACSPSLEKRMLWGSLRSTDDIAMPSWSSLSTHSAGSILHARDHGVMPPQNISITETTRSSLVGSRIDAVWSAVGGKRRLRSFRTSRKTLAPTSM